MKVKTVRKQMITHAVQVKLSVKPPPNIKHHLKNIISEIYTKVIKIINKVTKSHQSNHVNYHTYPKYHPKT